MAVLSVLSGLPVSAETGRAVPVSFTNTTIPLAEHPQGRQMMAKAATEAALVEIKVKFLDKTYKNDVKVRDPITGKKVRVSCRRFRGVSGFTLTIDKPSFDLTSQGLTISQNISRLSAQGIKIKWQLGPCAWSATGVGVSMSDIEFVYKAKPMLTFDGNGACRLTFNSQTEKLKVKIGDFNITGVQNDLDKLAKDAFREGINAALSAMYGNLMADSLAKVTVDMCGNG
ncbi:MAG: hypothetical protein ABIO65_01930 [Nitrospiria bacterium]